MKAFDKNRLMLSGVLFILVIALLMLIGSDIFTYSRYETNVTSQNNITTAVYLLNDEYQTINVKLPDVIPDNGQYEYRFSISNFKDDLHCDTNLKYRIRIRATTNLHIDYDLYDTFDIQNANSIITSNSPAQDSDGTYFITILTDYKTMLYSEDKTDNFTLLFDFHVDENYDSNNPNAPNTYNYRDAKFSGIAELIEINIESKQILATDA